MLRIGSRQRKSKKVIMAKLWRSTLKPEPLRFQMTFYPQLIAYLSDSPMLNLGSSASDIEPFIALVQGV
jgi:hypothetical protein